MTWSEEANRLEGLIYGWNFGSHRFELLQLCFPWLHKAEIQLADAGRPPYAPLICCIESKRGRPPEECGTDEAIPETTCYINCIVFILRMISVYHRYF